MATFIATDLPAGRDATKATAGRSYMRHCIQGDHIKWPGHLDGLSEKSLSQAAGRFESDRSKATDPRAGSPCMGSVT